MILDPPAPALDQQFEASDLSILRLNEPQALRPAIRVACEKRGDRFVFSIQDNGLGIPDQDRSKLFQRFKRGSNVQGIAGTGLGLHIVKEMVLGHGGEVWIESKQGVGTKFFLAIPEVPVQPGHSTVSSVG